MREMGARRRGRRGALAAVAWATVCGWSVAGAEGAVETTFELRPAPPAPRALPPLPPTSVFPVQLVLDDDGAEGAFGVASGGGAQQFLWLNRFAAPGAFTLEEIWVLFPGGSNMAVGAAVELVVFEDPDGDPTNGAVLVTAFDATIQAVDDVTFSVYPLPAPVTIGGSGDVLIGVVSRFVVSGVTPPTNPAALDTTASQGRSWLAIWSGDPPDPPLLPADVVTAPVDGFTAGNWMIRGFGTQAPVTAIPTLGPAGMAALAGLLLLLTLLALRRQGAGSGSATS